LENDFVTKILESRVVLGNKEKISDDLYIIPLYKSKIGNFDINTDIKNTTGNGNSNSAVFVPIGILEIKHDVIRLIRIEEKVKDDFFDIIPNLMSNINVNDIIKNIRI
jgi:uncharacterized spore protein YtfJ